MRAPQLLDLPVDLPGAVCGVAGVGAVLFIIVKLSQPCKLDGIPTVGSNSWLSSWWAGFTYLANATDVIQQGYEKHKPAPFKFAELQRWAVVLTSPEHVEEIRRASEDTLSLTEAKSEVVQTWYTIGPQMYLNPYHIPIVNSRLTRNIGVLHQAMRNEIVTAFDDVLNLTDNEWKSVPILGSVQKVICRTSNRVIVGLPLCRDPDWVALNIRHSLDFSKGAMVVRFFPSWLKPMAVRFFTNITQNYRHATKLLGPTIEERQNSLNKYGNEWAGKPNDLLSWLMEEAKGAELTVEALMLRVMGLNVAAIHTSSNSFTFVLLHLAANPEYTQPLREEVETVIEKEGWSKAALANMRKVDSFIKECQRFEGLSSVSMMRKAVKDFTFSDGTLVPKGTMIYAAARCIHRDEAYYDKAHTFEPWRFADLREEDGEGVNHHFVSTTAKYLPFGHGRRACPGRFFVASELKSMLAHVVVTYDVKLADDAPRPRSVYFGTATLPDPTAKIMFRRRAD